MVRSHSIDFVPHQLDNPLFRHYDEIDEAAKKFADAIGADEELCIKAARIACDPPTWASVDGLTDAEEKALQKERDEGFWHQTKSLRVTIITLCFSAIVQGWIQSVSNGANQTMPEYLGLKNDAPANHEWVSRTAIWRFAAINAITYLTAGVFGCWFSDPLQSSVLGRRGAIFASACLCIAASIGAASVSRNWWHLLIWRAILGLGLGAKASVTPIFGAEVSPAHLRGMLVMNWQLFDALGIFCGFSANLIFYWTNTLAWRFQIASACIPAGALVVLIWTIPESPRWLLKKGRGPEAFAALCALRHTPLQAATELFFANAQIQREIDYTKREKKRKQDIEATIAETNGGPPRNGKGQRLDDKGQSSSVHLEDVADVDVQDLGQFKKYRDEVKKTTYWNRILQLFRNGRTRRATVAAGVVMLGQQLCGINVLAFYSTIFIQNINNQTTKNINALWLSWGIGLANFLFTFPAYWGIDKYGRRFLLLATYPGMILSMLAACLSFLGGTGPEADSHRVVLVSVFIFVFIFFYSLGQGPVAFAYSSEVFPLFNREAGMSFAVFVNLFGAGLLTVFVPQAQVSIKTFTTNHQAHPDNPERVWLNRQAELVGSFAMLCTLSMILIYFFVPETKLATTREDKKRTLNYISLEELNQIFAVRMRDCRRYYINHVAMRKLHNLLSRCGITKGRLPIEESMHFWSKERLDRERRERAEAETEAQDSEKTEQGGEIEETDKGKDSAEVEVVHDEDVTERTSRGGGTDAIERVPLPRVVDTGGRIGFRPGDGQEGPTQPDPDTFGSGGME